MKQILCAAALVGLLAGGGQAVEVRHQPVYPGLDDPIRIEVSGAHQGATLHWGVNAVGPLWELAHAGYRPAGSTVDGTATRTTMEGPGTNGILRLVLGPFNYSNQLVRALNFAIQWDDGNWSNKDERNYNIPVSFGRITVSPEVPTINDVLTIRVRRSPGTGGQLRWGVNAEHDLWQPPQSAYWPSGTIPSRDGLAVDSPLGRPDSNGVATLTLGPFNRADQIVRTVHMAVHWGDDWDTDAGRNYNVEISFDTGTQAPRVAILSPQDGEVIIDNPHVLLQAERADRVEMWLNGRSIAALTETPLELRIPFTQLDYGRHQLIARAERSQRVGMQQVHFWKLPPHRLESLPPGTAWGATPHGDGTVTFALHAPHKRFVSLVGDFNHWDRFADMMNASPDGTWWLRRPVTNGLVHYQYCIEGRRLLADPCAHDVTWVDPRTGEEGYQPEHARSALSVGAPPFAWTANTYVRPPLDALVIYEFHIDDFAPGGGFTGITARLDYIRDLGVTALGPMPWMEFPHNHSWGYNPAFHFAPETAYGTPTQLKELIDAAHARGLAVIMDAVFNHMDRGSALYQLYGREYDASPYFRLFRGENWGFPDIDQRSPAVKRYTADAITHWLLDYRVDGIRFDATRFVEWEGYNTWGASWYAYAGRLADSNSYMIAEHMPSDPEFINVTEMDATWHDSFRWGVRGMVEESRLDRATLARLLDPTRDGFRSPLQRIAYTESHDEERVMHELKRRGMGDDEAWRRAELAIALTLTAPGPAMLYAGQEFGEDTPKVVGSNPLRWPATRGRLARRQHLLMEATRRLVHLRVAHPALRHGDVQVLADGLPADVAVYTRQAGTNVVVVVANFGRQPQTARVPLPVATAGDRWRDVTRNEPLSPAADATWTGPLLPGEVRVLATER